MINNAKPRRATQTAIIAPSQPIAFPAATTTHRANAQQQIGTHAAPTEHEEIPEILPETEREKMRREPYERNRPPTADPSEARGDRGRMASRRPWGVAGIAPEPDGARAAPEVAGMEPGRSKRRASVFWLAAPLFFPTFLASRLLRCVCEPRSDTTGSCGEGGSALYTWERATLVGPPAQRPRGELLVSAAWRKRGTGLETGDQSSYWFEVVQIV